MATIIAEIRMVMKKGPGATLLVTSDGIIVILTSARNGRFYNWNDLDSLAYCNFNENRPIKVQRSMCRRQRRNIQRSDIKDKVWLHMSTVGFKTSTCTKSLTRSCRKEFAFRRNKIVFKIFLRNSPKTIIIVVIQMAMMKALGAIPPIQM